MDHARIVKMAGTACRLGPLAYTTPQASTSTARQIVPFSTSAPPYRPLFACDQRRHAREASFGPRNIRLLSQSASLKATKLRTNLQREASSAATRDTRADGKGSRGKYGQDEHRGPRQETWVRWVMQRAKWLPVILCIPHIGTIGFIEGGSMAPTLNPKEGDRDFVVLNKLYAKARIMSIGDVVLFTSPLDPGLIVAKRILAMPGDIVSVHVAQSERASASKFWWLPQSARTATEAQTRIRVPAGHVWVEGDASTFDMSDEHRLGGHQNITGLHHRSRDSREFGPIPMGLISARVDAVLWPLSRFGRLAPRPDFDTQKHQELHQLRAQRGKFGSGHGREAHPDDSSLTPYTHWEWPDRASVAPLDNTSGSAQGTTSEAIANHEPQSLPRPRRRRRRGDDKEADALFDERWRQYLNFVSRGGQLGDDLQREGTEADDR